MFRIQVLGNSQDLGSRNSWGLGFRDQGLAGNTWSLRFKEFVRV